MKRRHILGIVALLLLVAVWGFRVRVKKADAARGNERGKAAETETASKQAREAARAQFLREWEASRTPPRKGTNAADVYNNAFALYDALTDEEKKMIANPREEVDEDKADALFKKIQPILELMRKAAQADYSDWGIGSVAADGMSAFMEKTMNLKEKSAKLGEVALWSAAYRFASEPQGAIEDLMARVQLGRSLSNVNPETDDQFAFQRSAIDLIQLHMAEVKPETLAGTTELLRALSGAEDFSSMEKVAPLVRQLFELMAKPENKQDIIGNYAEDDQPRIRAMLDNPVSLSAEAEWLGQLARDFGKHTQMTEPQFKAWWQGIEAVAAAHPMGTEITKHMYETRTRLWRVQIEGTMLAAGLAIAQKGSGQLGVFTDPTTGNAFTYAPTPDGGFELRSTFKLEEDKPVTMTFPPPSR